MITESRSSSSSSLLDGRGDVRIDIRSDGRGDIRIDSRGLVDGGGRGVDRLELGPGGRGSFEVMRSSSSAFSSYASNHYNNGAAVGGAVGVKDNRNKSKTFYMCVFVSPRRDILSL